MFNDNGQRCWLMNFNGSGLMAMIIITHATVVMNANQVVVLVVDLTNKQNHLKVTDT